MGIAHWDNVESHRRAKSELDATWQRLGQAAGAKDVAPPLAYGEPAERPPNILNVDEVELERWGAATSAPLATRSAPTRPTSAGSGSTRARVARCRTATPRKRRSS